MSTGRIITFYSYKGGVGRTMAVANVGALLAQWGLRVLCIDWDLEAPGLDRYLKVEGGREQSEGLVDLITAFGVDTAPDWRDFVSRCLLESGETVDIIHAGRNDQQFLTRMHAIDWEGLYEKGLGGYVEQLRTEWSETYNFILIDSRTGVTDAGGICTAQLPDDLVVLFTANSQSFDGVLRVIELAEQQRDKLPLDRPRALVLPLISRFEIRVEYEEAHVWLDKFEHRLRPHLEEWLEPEHVADALAVLRVPYVPYWSFGERLAVVERGTSDPDDLGYTYESIAALLVNGLTRLMDLRTERAIFIDQARAVHYKGDIRYDIAISSDSKDEHFLKELAAELTKKGARTATWVETGANLPEPSDDIFSLATNYIFIIGRDWNPLREVLLDHLLDLQATSVDPRLIVPLLRHGAQKSKLPVAVKRLVSLTEKATVEGTAEGLLSLLEIPLREEKVVVAGLNTDGITPIEKMGWMELDEELGAIFERLPPSLGREKEIIEGLGESVGADAKALGGLVQRLNSTSDSRLGNRLRQKMKSRLNQTGTMMRVRAVALNEARQAVAEKIPRLRTLLTAARDLDMLTLESDAYGSMTELGTALSYAQDSLRGLIKSIKDTPEVTSGYRRGKQQLLDALFLCIERNNSLGEVLEIVLGASNSLENQAP